MPQEGAPRTTLLVAPVSVISSWQFQITKFCKENYLTVELYLGPQRKKLLNRIKRKNDIDILLTSYETLSSDWNNFREAHEEKEEAKAQETQHKKKPKKKARKSKDTCK